jgi:hypothetical protein
MISQVVISQVAMCFLLWGRSGWPGQLFVQWRRLGTVGGTASLPGTHVTLNRSPRRMPFWELPTPAPADRRNVIGFRDGQRTREPFRRQRQPPWLMR